MVLFTRYIGVTMIADQFTEHVNAIGGVMIMVIGFMLWPGNKD